MRRRVYRQCWPQCYIAVSVELLRELAEVQIELMGLNLKRMYKMQDASENPESIKRRIEAVSTIQSKLEKFGNTLGHGNLEEQENARPESGNPDERATEEGTEKEASTEDVGVVSEKTVGEKSLGS